MPAKKVIHEYFEDKTYANERDRFSLLISEVREATAKINNVEVKDNKFVIIIIKLNLLIMLN